MFILLVCIMPKGKELKVVAKEDLGSSSRVSETGTKPMLSVTVHEPTGLFLGQAHVEIPSPYLSDKS